MERCKHDAQATTCRLCYLEKNRNKNNIKTTPKIKVDKCIYLGKRARNSDGSIKTELCTTGCAKGTKLDVFECQVFGETTLSKCRNCSSKCTNIQKIVRQKESSFDIPPNLKQLPKIGVVLGTQGWYNLTELQINVIRRMCGQIPILVSEDLGQQVTPELFNLKKKYTEVDVWHNSRKLGHGAGDLSVFFKGLVWAKKNNIEYLVKVSRRLIIEVPFWIQYWTKRLIKDKCSVALQREKHYPWHIQTHCMILKVEDWFNDIQAVLPFEFDTKNTGSCVELYMYNMIEKHFKCKFSTLALLSASPTKKSPGVIWHSTHTLEDYKQIFLKYNIPMDKTFSTEASGLLKDFYIG
jgi:hypothetical protein